MVDGSRCLLRLLLALVGMSRCATALAQSPSPVEGASLSIEERFAAQEAEIRTLRQQLFEHSRLIQRLPPTTGVMRTALLEAAADGKQDTAAKPKDGDKKSLEEQFKSFDGDWKAFKDKQKKDKEEADKKPQVTLYGQVQGDFVSFDQKRASSTSCVAAT